MKRAIIDLEYPKSMRTMHFVHLNHRARENYSSKQGI